MNAKAQQIADTIKVGSVLTYEIPSLSTNSVKVEEVTVSHFKGKSVYFTDGSYSNLRSLHTYTVKSI